MNMKTATFFSIFFVIFSVFGREEISFEKQGRKVDGIIARTKKKLDESYANAKKYYRLARCKAADDVNDLKKDARKKVDNGISAVRSTADSAGKKAKSAGKKISRKARREAKDVF